MGIFPYVFKLLGSPAQELRAVLISLWSKILAVDSECKLDLTKPPTNPVRKGPAAPADKGYMYFIRTLGNARFDSSLRFQAAFVIAVFMDNNYKGQELCYEAGLLELALPQASDPDPLLRQARRKNDKP